MKSISLVLNAVLFVAVAILFYLHFSNANGVEVDEPVDEVAVKAGTPQFAYVNSDSVLEHYQFFQEKKEELEALQQKLDQQYKNRAQGLQQEVANFQQSLPNLTMGQAKALEEDLVKKQQNLRVYQENLAQELMKKESEVNQELYDKVTSYIKEYSEGKEIEMVVKYNQGSDVLYAGDAMDITWEIVEGLNNRYNEEKTTAEGSTK